MIDESDVIKRVLAGETELFRLLVERYARPVTRVIRNLTGDRHLGEDLAQDAFLAAYQRLGTFDPRKGRFGTWLLTIARNKSVNAIAKKRPVYRARVPDKLDPRGPMETLARGELCTALDEALRSLPLAQRTAFVLAEFEDLSYERIAQIEKVKIGTVRSRINRARNRLLRTLQRFPVDV